MLEVRDVSVAYGAIEVLRNVSLCAEPGTTTAVLGANGAGKSSLLRAISGVAPVRSGSILFDGQDVTQIPAHRRARLGLAHAMEGRRLFKPLSVQNNLRLSWQFGARAVPWPTALRDVYDRFPILAEKAHVPSGLLSGGQQQMVIISCATIRSPRYLLLDEPSLGLAPIIVSQIYEFITDFAQRSGIAIVLAEQMATLALKVSDRGYVLRRGRVVQHGDSRTLLANSAASLTASYL
ncbi:ABC transporter ATP-binding protein [Methylobacterium platani]|uniref:ABC transporter ATP-binding protein n=2 Tax=Methylobacterium platani TaxID=427683 RepID=A0A179SEZ0_9HYPH|nr:ABC transporter ATP-binding protein [Methylobacterium platani]KMO13536.1 branched-chain amino acid ABC transporter [Methylobacterium platani JCM 14648]OAS25059.1 ABC transporter ATP-binding protein [Methylobacterium platani]